MLFTNSIILDVLLIFSSVIVSAYLFFTRNFNHWKKRGIPYKKPIPFVGNFLEVLQLKKNISEVVEDVYKETTEPLLGIFVVDKPLLFVKDLELIRHVVVRSFSHFSDTSFANRIGDVSRYVLPCMKGHEWKEFRKYQASAFNTVNLKNGYFDSILENGQELDLYLERELENSDLINCKELAEIFSAENAAYVSLGVKGNCFREKNSKYLRIMHNLFDATKLKRDIVIGSFLLYPNMVNALKLNMIDQKTEAIFREELFKTVKKREASGSLGNDYVAFLMNWRNDKNFEKENIKFGVEPMVGQAITFALGAHETLTSCISFTLYELAANPGIQTKLREHINDVLEQSEDQALTYETVVGKMKYLEMVIKESLRKHPPITVMSRDCNKDFTMPDTGYFIEKGTTLFLPIIAIQNDPQYFPNPEIFDPERFSPENIGKIHPGTYMPFSGGSRSCMGEKMAFMLAKIAISTIIRKYELRFRDESQKKLKLHTRTYISVPEDDSVILRFKKILV